MSSRDEVQKMINIRNEVDSRFNEMVNLMEANVELELQQHQLFKVRKSKLAIVENVLCEKIELQFELQISFFNITLLEGNKLLREGLL